MNRMTVKTFSFLFVSVFHTIFLLHLLTVALCITLAGLATFAQHQKGFWEKSFNHLFDVLSYRILSSDHIRKLNIQLSIFLINALCIVIQA